jgi:tRNA threonylcarbamoyladenosine modification (KEOPS) complex Cgi121 subunit
MLKHLEEDGKFVEISGFRDIQIEDPTHFLSAVRKALPNNVEVQFFNADLVASWQHLYFAIANALMAFRTERNVSKSIAVEVALYASAQRQITKAIERIGVTKDTANVAMIVVCESEDSAKATLKAVAKRLVKEPDEKVLELSPEKIKLIKRVFGISDVELEAVAGAKDNAAEALVDAVIERVALLSTQL